MFTANRRDYFRLILLICISVCLSHCGSWKTKTSETQAVFSDDNSSIAYIFSRWESKSLYPSGNDIKNEQFQLFKADTLLNNPIPITDLMDGEVNILFYMKAAGYIVAGLQEKSFYIWDLDGNLLKTIKPINSTSCKSKVGNFQRIMAIPSPDGSLIAVVQTTAECSIRIELLDTQQSYSVLKSATIQSTDFSTLSWVNQEELLIELCDDYCGDSYYAMGIQFDPIKLDATYKDLEACLFTQTSSSFINPYGYVLQINFDSNSLERIHYTETDFKDYVNSDYYRLGCSFFNREE
ncbi:hypothetical protein EP331_08875 [bacterium]|nr:MAG: hypothetical protein EP331_08875 [bacterium]